MRTTAMSEVPLSAVHGFIRELGLNPGQVTELHITRESVRVTRMMPLGPVEVDIKGATRVTFQTGEIQALLNELRVAREQIARVQTVARHANEMTGAAMDPVWVLDALSSAKWAAVAQEWNPDV